MATWRELVLAFGTSPHRLSLLGGMLRALQALRAAGCQRAYINGSFVTAKAVPGDYDGCYDLAGVELSRLPAALQDFSNQRAAQKAAFGGELFPASWQADWQGRPYLEFFQQDRYGNPKGIIAIDLIGGGLP
jgi:hypothetical protein